jgi:hypothetical protein
MTAQTETTGFPLDWNEWRKEWNEWREAHADALKTTRERFPGKNFLATEKLGTWNIGGRIVEMSEMTFPNLTERDESGRLKRYDIRGIGLTFGVGVAGEGDVVHSWDELNEALGI